MFRAPRDCRLVRRVLGWDGQGGCCLKDAGEEFGITRERARQIYDQAIEQIRSAEVSSSLDEALAFVNRMANRAAGDIETELQLRRFTQISVCNASPAEDGSSIWTDPGIHPGGNRREIVCRGRPGRGPVDY